jgi:hypothetical protein
MAAAVCLGSTMSAIADQPDHFRTEVAPIFERHCVGCHSGDAAKGALSLTGRQQAMAGGESGPAIVPGKPDASLIVEYVSGAKPQMPKDAPALSTEQVAAIRQWIAAGASWPDDFVLTAKKTVDADWWSLKPLARVSVPEMADLWVRTTVDAFVLERLRENDLSPAADADRRTLVRRLTYDLHGLPPTPEEIDAFVADSRSEAYERLVDRLLSSPRYGERFGRFWLDIVHYGESHGYDKDKPRPNAWPYRDWLIRSLNDDKPYDQFVAEQVAGDVIAKDDREAIAATGFIVAGPWDFVGHAELREGTADKDIARANDRDDMVANTMSTFMSLTVHCARCHDHKFDPITQQDYYGLQAVFAGVDRADREYGADPSVARQRLQLNRNKGDLESQLAKLRKEKERDAGTAEGESEVQQKLEEVNRQLGALATPRFVYAAASEFPPTGSFTPAATPRVVHLLARGDVRSRGAPMAPAGVRCVQGPDSRFALSENDPESLRRAELARWLVDPRNALLRRSIVNRVWQFHFGAGIVDTPNDFGRMGSLPTHPDLLEWLAGWLADNGRSLKKLHRLIVTSSVYRQSSQDIPQYAKVDSGNRYLWRMNRQRLDADCVRDAMLAVAGKLDLTMGGPSVQHFYFKDDHSPIYDYTRFDVDDPRSMRRSVYRFLVRSVPDPFLECLDCADPSIMTPRRNTTLTSIQALALLNNPFVTRAAEHYANRVRAMAQDERSQIEIAYHLALGRKPSEQEAAALSEYVARHGLENGCRVIFNSNEFLFVD